jgi:hypothetical protein
MGWTTGPRLLSGLAMTAILIETKSQELTNGVLFGVRGKSRCCAAGWWRDEWWTLHQTCVWEKVLLQRIARSSPYLPPNRLPSRAGDSQRSSPNVEVPLQGLNRIPLLSSSTFLARRTLGVTRLLRKDGAIGKGARWHRCVQGGAARRKSALMIQ